MEELPRGQWGVDPYDRHELRWWNGTAWTEHVLDGSQSAVDPIGQAKGDRVDRRVVLHLVLVVLTLGLSFMAWRAVQSVRGGRANEARAWTVGGLVWLVLLVSLSDGIGGRPTGVHLDQAAPAPRMSQPVERFVPDTEPAPVGTAAARLVGSARSVEAGGSESQGTSTTAAPRTTSRSTARDVPGTTSSTAPRTTFRTTTTGTTPVRTWTRKSVRTPDTDDPTQSPTPTAGPTTAGPTQQPVDRRYGSCRAVVAHGLGPYHRGEPEYEWYPDFNHDGVVCDC